MIYRLGLKKGGVSENKPGWLFKRYTPGINQL